MQVGCCTGLVVNRLGLPPPLALAQAAGIYGEAGGQAQGGPADASEGLSKVSGTWHGQARTWAWNPVYSEWQLLHVIREGDTLWRMGQTYYGESSTANVRRICNLEQNAPIIGADRDCAQGVPGDVLLIPGLEQPSNQPPASPPGGAVPPPDGYEPPTFPTDPGLDQRPPGYPDDWPWPPVWDTTPAEPPAEPAEPTEPTEPAEPEPVGAITRPGTSQKFWTAGKIVAAAGGGLGVLGLIVWAAVAAGKPKRRKRRK